MTEKKELQLLRQLLDSAEGQIRQAKSILFASEISEKAQKIEKSNKDTVVEGVFDGEGMIDSGGKRYPVPANYASKSKLVSGDVLKLTILDDGSFVYKQIAPVLRKKLIGEVKEIEKGRFCVEVGGKLYKVLLASVTYFKADLGDTVTIVVPKDTESEWAALENVLKDVAVS